MSVLFPKMIRMAKIDSMAVTPTDVIEHVHQSEDRLALAVFCARYACEVLDIHFAV